MSRQTMEDALAPVMAQYHAEAVAATWGHLAPRKRQAYSGYIVFAVPEYDSGNPCIVESWFKGLDDSPWLYDAMVEFAERQYKVGVYRFDGTICNYKFEGTVRRIET